MIILFLTLIPSFPTLKNKKSLYKYFQYIIEYEHKYVSIY